MVGEQTFLKWISLILNAASGTLTPALIYVLFSFSVFIQFLSPVSHWSVFKRFPTILEPHPPFCLYSCLTSHPGGCSSLISFSMPPMQKSVLSRRVVCTHIRTSKSTAAWTSCQKLIHAQNLCQDVPHHCSSVALADSLSVSLLSDACVLKGTWNR